MTCRSDYLSLLVRRAAVAVAGFGLALPSLAEFIPGRIYIAAAHQQGCGVGRDRIYEFDPATGASRLYQTVPADLCGGLTAITFSPDGSRMRCANFYRSEILEIDGDGQFGVPLGRADGIHIPVDVEYSAGGDFFVMNGGAIPQNITRFPADGSTPIVMPTDDIGPIAPTGDGGAYFAQSHSSLIYRFDAMGHRALFATMPNNAINGRIFVTDAGDVLVTSTTGIHRYAQGDAENHELLSPLFATICDLSPDGLTLFAVLPQISSFQIYAIDLPTGATRLLGATPGTAQGFLTADFAFYVPEPPCLVPMLVALCGIASRRRQKSIRTHGG